MQNYIDDLLNYFKVAKIASTPEQVNLKDVLMQVLGKLSRPIKKAHAQVIVGDLPSLEIATDLISILFLNLISNGLQHQKDNVAPIINITAEYERTTSSWKITVKDNGIEFNSKYPTGILEPFDLLYGYNLLKGSGIGLIICQKIVSRHHEKITVKAIPGEGTKVVVTLPEEQPKITNSLS
jgi:light-regulated signal transduction histidine kinase (bacteriophytochrome)